MKGRITIIFALAVTLIVMVAPGADANQLSFAERPRSDGLEFQVSFTDSLRKPWTVDFVLPTAVTHDGGGYVPYNHDAWVAQVSTAIAAAVPSYHGLVSAEVRSVQDGFRLFVKTKDNVKGEQALASLRSIASAATATYYSGHGLVLVHGHDILPDYGRAALHFVPGLQPLANALAALVPHGSDRDTVGLALAFIQNIPYDHAVATGYGSAFQVPPVLLVQNKGVCDSKSVAMASLVATLLPRVPMVIVIVRGFPGHAFLGVGLPVQPGERILHRDGRDYVLMEPVGPALMPIGRVSEAASVGLGRTSDMTVFPVAVGAPP